MFCSCVLLAAVVLGKSVVWLEVEGFFVVGVVLTANVVAVVAGVVLSVVTRVVFAWVTDVVFAGLVAVGCVGNTSVHFLLLVWGRQCREEFPLACSLDFLQTLSMRQVLACKHN